MSTPTLVPNNFLSKVLAEFGMQWTHIAILSGIGFSSFGLDKYLHPGIWILATIAAFSLVYFFRRQIPSNFGRVAVWCIPIAVAAAAVPLLIIWSRALPILSTIASHRKLATCYAALVVLMPVAVMICSYRQQEDTFGGVYPEPLRETIREYIASGLLYREDQVYKIEVLRSDGQEIQFKTDLSYKLVNRSGSDQKWNAGFVSSAASAEYLSAELDGRSLDVNDHDYLTNRGFQVSGLLAAKQSVALKFSARETFAQNANELYTAYIPATSLSLHLTNPFSPSAQLNVESLLPTKVLPDYDSNVAVYKTPGGVLPFQGFRLYWRHQQAASQP